jgi:hypothetical protein
MKGKLLLCTLPVFLATNLLAGRPQRHIEETMPRAAQRGTTVEVAIRGLGLAAPREVVFYRGGIEAVDFTPMEKLERVTNLAHGIQIAEEIRCKFKVAPDCPVGEHPFRIRTATQLSTVGTFWVTPFPLVQEAEAEGYGKNDTPQTAETLQTSPATIYGKIAKGDPDNFRITRKTGERISVEIDCVRLTDLAYGEGEFDLRARVYSPDGKLLKENDDSPLHRQDPILTTLAPKDGDYTVEISQSVYTPRGRVFYLAHIGKFPRPQTAFPLGGQPGEKLQLQVPGFADKTTVRLPEIGESYAWYPEAEGEQAPSPISLRIAKLPNQFENTQPIQLPAALNGIITKTREKDIWKLQANKGDRHQVQVFARGLGSPLDAKISIHEDGSDRPTIQADQVSPGDSPYYSMSNQIRRKALLDPIVLWEPKSDGTHILEITDVRGMGSPDSTYRIEISKVRDAIHTYLSPRVIDSMQCPRLTSPTISQGGRWTMSFLLKQGLGNEYSGDIRLEAEGLPKGVAMWSPTFPANAREIPVHFTASKDTPQQSAIFEVHAVAADASTKLESRCQESFPYLSRSGGRARHPVSVDSYILAVTKPAPFSLTVEPPSIPLVRNGELSLTVRAERAEGFDEAIEVKSEWLPTGVSSAPAALIPAGLSEIAFNLSASGGAALQTNQISLIGTTLEYGESGAYTGVGRTRVASEFFPIEVVDPHFQLKSSPTAIRRGQTAQFVWQVEHLRKFEGKACATLLGLPKGVEAKGTANLESGSHQIAFELMAKSDALIGNYRELTCEVSVPEGGQMVRQRIGKGILRIDPALN